MAVPGDPFHLAFPLATANGLPKGASLFSNIPQLIEQILFTAPGERVNRPDFGCGLSQLVFRPLDSSTAVTLQQMLQAQLQQYIAQYAEILSLSISTQDTTLRVQISFQDLAGGGPKQVEYARVFAGAAP